jgi:VRR-NUC domain
MRNEHEHRLQTVLAKYLDLNNYQFFAVANGGWRNKVVAAKLKAEGVKAGVADLFILLPNSTFHGLFVEVKIKGNSQQPNQKVFEQKARDCGYEYIIVRSLDELIEKLKYYESQKFIEQDKIMKAYREGYTDGKLENQMTIR